MTKFVLTTLVSSLLFCTSARCQDIQAITDDGRKVILKSDGTWKPISSKSLISDSAKESIKKSDSASSVFKPKGDKFQIWYNPSKWHMKKAADSDKPGFEHKDGDIYAMVLAERFSMSLEALRDLAINNARSAAPDAKVIFEEERVVNGKKVLCMKIDGTIAGVQFSYFGYYYAGKGGIIQLITYTSQNLMDEYQGEMAEFLNGLIIKD